MQKVLRRRIFRDLKENCFRYLALGLLIILGMYIIVSLVGAADTIMIGTAEAAEKNRLEDGQFVTLVPLTDEEKGNLEKSGITLEEHFYLDYSLENDSVLRVSERRDQVDLIQADFGRAPEMQGEIFLEKRYCEEHEISIGDEIIVGGQLFQVCGIGTSPDYDAPYRNLSDSAVDSRQFGVGFLTEEDYGILRDEQKSLQSEEFVYAYLLNGELTQNELKEKLQQLSIGADRAAVGYFSDSAFSAGISNLMQFIPAADNQRIGAAADDQFINKAAGLAAGVILLILFAYVISVFVVHGIQREASTIGTLYALGITKNELLRHYLSLPIFVTLIGGVIGTVIGYSGFGVDVQMGDCYEYFSVPELDTVYEPYLFIYGIVMPPTAAAIINFLVIRSNLARPVLALIRKEQKTEKSRNIRLKSGNFVRVFQVRQLLRERRTAFTVFFGMFISLLIVMLALDCYVLCGHVKTDYGEDTRFEYMYTYKYSDEQAPQDGEAAYGVKLKKEVLGYNFDVTLLGIDEDNPYFDAEVEKGKDRVLISSAMAQKYRLRTGDELTLEDEEHDRNYTFVIDGIVRYSSGFFAFMDIDSMRSLMGQDESYYNIVFSDHALNIDSDRLYSATSREEIEKSASVFAELMMPMILMMTSASAFIFAVVMYLMMKVMIDRSAMSISLMKVFGYRKKEIGKLYLNGNLLVVAVSALIAIPLAKIIMDSIFPYLVSNVACGVYLTFSPLHYAGLFGGILFLYFFINQILLRRINRILPAEALKDRE